MKRFYFTTKSCIYFFTVLLLTAASSADERIVPVSRLFLGVDRCVWEPSRVGSFSYQPQMQDVSSCKQFVEEHDWIFVGSGDDASRNAYQAPTTTCDCGRNIMKWFFTTTWGEYKCNGISYSCTKPDDGCKWIKTGKSSVEISASEECRAMALQGGGAYYGWNGGQAASIQPDCSCICGETKTHWYSENNAATNWQFVCEGITYKCLARPAFTPDMFDKNVLPFKSHEKKEIKTTPEH